VLLANPLDLEEGGLAADGGAVVGHALAPQCHEVDQEERQA
jgi:hypothetical protein